VHELQVENFSLKIISVPTTLVWKHFFSPWYFEVICSQIFLNISKPEVSARNWVTQLALPLPGRCTKTILYANTCPKPHVHLYPLSSITSQCAEPNQGLYGVFERLFWHICILL